MGIKQIPVLKRKDYIKEFETTMKQEIALHEKQREYVNDSLNVFKKSIEAGKKEFEKRLLGLQNYCLEIRNEFEDFYQSEEKFEDFNKKLSYLENLCKTLCEINQGLSEKIDNLPDHALMHQWIDYIFDVFHSQLSEIKKHINQLAEDIRLLNRKNEFYAKNGEDTLNELRNENKKQQQQIEYLKESLKVAIHNEEGIKKERKNQQRTILYLEKKFEYLDSKIKKLEEK